MPFEVDFEWVRRICKRGSHGLTQVLKSFRDSSVEYPFHKKGGRHSDTLSDLGALETPKKYI